MNPIKEYKHYIVIVLITIVLGYFLGITVSSVVDYRLKDAVINIPRQKNNIVVKLDDYNLHESFKGYNSEKKLNKNKKNSKSPKKDKKDKKGKKDKDVKKGKKDKKGKKGKKTNNKSKNKTYTPEFFENFTSSPEDPNLMAYAKLYHSSTKNPVESHFKAANEESSAQYFQKID